MPENLPKKGGDNGKKNVFFDLLQTVENGGCSAKLPAGKLTELLQDIPMLKDSRILVDIETHDDAGVFKINEEMALIVTTDFFPPICSEACVFGRIAACNALSDVYAMGGTPLLTLNLTMFPSTKIPLKILHDILLGGQEKVTEAGAFTMGGHTIEEEIPKYGLAVVGTVHPKKIISNASALAGEILLLTKPLGTGVLAAAHRLKLANKEAYELSLEQMQLLNKEGAELMRKYEVRCATDVTGFGLLGHAWKMALASKVKLKIQTSALPVFPQVLNLLEMGCIPGTTFKNLDFVAPFLVVDPKVSLTRKMLACDAQTSGGLLMSVSASKAEALVEDLRKGAYPYTKIIGQVEEGEPQLLLY